MRKKVAINVKEKYTDTNHYQKHFTLDDRIKIQKIMSENRDENGCLTIFLKDIGRMLENDPSTISKEVKKHRIFKPAKDTDNFRLLNQICENFDECRLYYNNTYNWKSYIKNNTKCIKKCQNFKEKVCSHLKKFPWVCNGCPKSKGCHLNKYYYYSDIAQKDYVKTLSESREGINLTEDEFKELDHIVSALIMEKKQPIAHIVNSNDLCVSERVIYNYFEKGYFTAKNTDLRRKVTYKKRKTSKDSPVIIRKRKIGRMYNDYLKYIETNPDVSIVQMDTVEGKREENGYLLTLHFVKFNFQLAYYIHEQTSENVINVINNICHTLGLENFKKLFEVILTDNGHEFSNPEAIEINPETGEYRTKVFYCDPLASRQKGSCERNHEYIRYIIPRFSSLLNLSQEKVDLMMSHINSTIRPSKRSCPYDFMELEYGKEILDLLKIKKIDPKEVTLSKDLIK